MPSIFLIRPDRYDALVLCLLLIWLSAANAHANTHPPFEVTGTVIHNHDGDTIDLQTASRGVIKVRISGADAPETGQAYWKAARNHLRTLVTGKTTIAWCYKQDRYGREICHVRVGTTDMSQDLIQNGFAWYAHMYSQEFSQEQRATYARAEEEARASMTRLWSHPNPMPPWECRRLRKAGKKCH